MLCCVVCIWSAPRHFCLSKRCCALARSCKGHRLDTPRWGLCSPRRHWVPPGNSSPSQPLEFCAWNSLHQCPQTAALGTSTAHLLFLNKGSLKHSHVRVFTGHLRLLLCRVEELPQTPEAHRAQQNCFLDGTFRKAKFDNLSGAYNICLQFFWIL